MEKNRGEVIQEKSIKSLALAVNVCDNRQWFTFTQFTFYVYIITATLVVVVVVAGRQAKSTNIITILCVIYFYYKI